MIPGTGIDIPLAVSEAERLGQAAFGESSRWDCEASSGFSTVWPSPMGWVYINTLSLDSSSRLELGISGVSTLLTWNRFSAPEIYFSGFEGDLSPGWSTSTPSSIAEDSGGWIIAIPEPSSVLLLLTAMAGLFILRPSRRS